MDCPAEFSVVRKELQNLPGVLDIRADYLDRVLHVHLASQQLRSADIVDHLQGIGFTSRYLADRSEGHLAGAHVAWRQRWVWSSGLLLSFALLARIAGLSAGWPASLAVGAALAAGVPVAEAALRSLRFGRIDMNVLMIVAAAGAVGIGEWFEAATALFLFGVAVWLESYSVRRARRAVMSLSEFLPQLAHRLTDRADRQTTLASDLETSSSAVEDVHPERLELGDLVLIRPGERIPIDGDVVAGESCVDESAITGETMPAEKSAGDCVFAGTQNGDGALTVQATTRAGETAVSHIARLVDQARTESSPTERFIDRFARIYTPVVLALAGFIGLVLPATLCVLGRLTPLASFSDWFYRGLVFMVIACPCALVISTPVTIVCALQRAARLGALIKGGRHVENLGRVKAVAFDKTGTLTTGRMRVDEVAATADASEPEVLALAAALESHSEHPIAQAIVRESTQRGIAIPAASGIQFYRGAGVSGSCRGRTYRIGSARFVGDAARQEGLPIEDDGILVFLATDNQLVGVIRLGDEVRSDAAEALAGLRRLGITKLVMLTGDRPTPAMVLGRRIGIDDVRSQLLPDEKIAGVQQIRAQFPLTAMVGDGINDAPALAAADVGVAMGREASHLAIDTADVVLLSPHLDRLVRLIKLGRATRLRLWQNILLSLGIKAAIMLLTVAGLGTMWLAVAADVGASIAVIANGMRLLRLP
jgi:Cd2+/Zn2+-exporting ATPase